MEEPKEGIDFLDFETDDYNEKIMIEYQQQSDGEKDYLMIGTDDNCYYLNKKQTQKFYEYLKSKLNQ